MVQTMSHLDMALESYGPTKPVKKMKGNESWVESITLTPPPLVLLMECKGCVKLKETNSLSATLKIVNYQNHLYIFTTRMKTFNAHLHAGESIQKASA